MNTNSYGVLAFMGRKSPASAPADEVTNGANAPAYSKEDLMKKVRELGRDSASGKDSLPRLAVQVVKGAADGILNTEKDPETKLDDAAVIYQEYIEAESRKSVLEHSAIGKKANVSKLRQLVIFGGMTTCDPMGVIDRTVILHKDMIAAQEKVLDTYKSFVAVARTQIANSDNELTDEQIKGAIRKRAPADKTVVKELQRIEKLLRDLITGDSKAGQDQHDEVIAAQEALERRLKELTEEKSASDFMDQAAALGVDPDSELGQQLMTLVRKH